MLGAKDQGRFGSLLNAISKEQGILPPCSLAPAELEKHSRMKNIETRKILLVEDNQDDELLMLHAFQANKILNEVVVTRDGAEALEYLTGTGKFAGRDLNEMPAVTFLDLNLPKISGLDVLRKLRSNPATKLLPVVVVTTSNEEEDLIKSYSLGANSYVRKPVDMSQFIEAVRQLGMYWLLLNEIPPERGGAAP